MSRKDKQENSLCRPSNGILRPLFTAACFLPLKLTKSATKIGTVATLCWMTTGHDVARRECLHVQNCRTELEEMLQSTNKRDGVTAVTASPVHFQAGGVRLSLPFHDVLRSKRSETLTAFLSLNQRSQPMGQFDLFSKSLLAWWVLDGWSSGNKRMFYLPFRTNTSVTNCATQPQSTENRIKLTQSQCPKSHYGPIILLQKMINGQRCSGQFRNANYWLIVDWPHQSIDLMIAAYPLTCSNFPILQ